MSVLIYMRVCTPDTTDADSRTSMRSVMQRVIAVARAQGVLMGFNDWQQKESQSNYSMKSGSLDELTQLIEKECLPENIIDTMRHNAPPGTADKDIMFTFVDYAKEVPPDLLKMLDTTLDTVEFTRAFPPKVIPK